MYIYIYIHIYTHTSDLAILGSKGVYIHTYIYAHIHTYRYMNNSCETWSMVPLAYTPVYAHIRLFTRIYACLRTYQRSCNMRIESRPTCCLDARNEGRAHDALRNIIEAQNILNVSRAWFQRLQPLALLTYVTLRIKYKTCIYIRARG